MLGLRIVRGDLGGEHVEVTGLLVAQIGVSRLRKARLLCLFGRRAGGIAEQVVVMRWIWLVVVHRVVVVGLTVVIVVVTDVR